MYGLRMIWQHGVHYNFTWPLEVGAVAKAPDWNPEPVCGGGLHFLPEGKGNYLLLNGFYWVVIEFDETKMVRIDKEKAKVEECKIVFIAHPHDVDEVVKVFTYFDLTNLSRPEMWWLNSMTGGAIKFINDTLYGPLETFKTKT